MYGVDMFHTLLYACHVRDSDNRERGALAYWLFAGNMGT